MQRICGDPLQNSPHSILMKKGKFDCRSRFAWFRQVVEYLAYPGQVRRVDEVETAFSCEFMLAVTQHSLDRRALIPHHPVTTNDGDDIGRILDQRTKEFVRLFQFLLCEISLGDVGVRNNGTTSVHLQ